VAVLCAVLFAALLGAVDEFHQQWIPGRSMEFFDWVADFVGGSTGAFGAAVAASQLPFLLTRKIPPLPAPLRIESPFILAFDMRFRYVVAFEALNSMGGAT